MALATNSTDESLSLGEWVPVETVSIRQRMSPVVVATSDSNNPQTKTVISLDHGTMLWVMALVVGITIGAVVILATRKCNC